MNFATPISSSPPAPVHSPPATSNAAANTRQAEQGEGNERQEGRGVLERESETKLGVESSRLLQELRSKHGLSISGAMSTPAKHEPLFSPLSLSVLDGRRGREASAEQAEGERVAAAGAQRGLEVHGKDLKGDGSGDIQVRAYQLHDNVCVCV